MPAPASEPLRPSQALPSPAWLLALALLIANDHWLKHADLLPGVVTGKLSDVAGMIVAPTLLAVIIGARSRRQLLGCHVAVGLVFAAIQLWPAFAGLWSAAMGLFGYPWTITPDVSDLLALPALLASWQLLVPHMAAERSPMSAARRSAVVGLSALGLWASVATTQSEPELVLPPMVGQFAINNANDTDIALHIRYRRDEVTLDCDAVREDPGRLLSADAFGEAEHWLLPPSANLGVMVDEEAACDAVWVAGDGIEPTIFFFEPAALGIQVFMGTAALDEIIDEDGYLALVYDEDGRAEWVGDLSFRYTPRTDPPAQPASCETPTGERRVAWSDNVPERAAEILALEPGIDGCFELELQDYVDAMPWQSPYLWYVCAPADAMPFVAGEFIEVLEIVGSGDVRELRVTLLDPTTLEPQADGNGRLTRLLRLLRGGNNPSLIGPAINRDVVGVPASACAWVIEPGCATAERNAELEVVGAGAPLPLDQPIGFADSPGADAFVYTLVLAYVRQRAVVDASCSNGATNLSYDIDLALIEEPLL